jgi:hypothetical protein
MKKIIYLFLFICFIQSNAQSIFSTLSINKKEDFNENEKVSKITTYLTFYNRNGVEKTKEITVFNKMKRKISELRYDYNDKLIVRITVLYDSTNVKKTFQKFERWIPYIGYRYEMKIYEYDKNGFLIKITDKDQFDNLILETNIINNDKGLPIELQVKDVNTDSYGKETGEYDYETNTVTTRVYNNKGELLSISTGKIDFKVKDKNNLYNEYDDLIKSGDNEYEYKYDKHKNWIKKVRYKIENGVRNKKSMEIREIKYLK